MNVWHSLLVKLQLMTLDELIVSNLKTKFNEQKEKTRENSTNNKNRTNNKNCPSSEH